MKSLLVIGVILCLALEVAVAKVDQEEDNREIGAEEDLNDIADVYDDSNEEVDLSSDEATLKYLNATGVVNATNFESIFNVTKHAGFLHGFVEALSVILVSEIGDKTFFIAAIMAMTNNKLTIFLAAISALALMTILSALLGWVVTSFIPRAYTYYTCTAIMFLFGFKMLYEAWKMKPDETDELQHEVEQELQRRGSIASSIGSNRHDEDGGESGNPNQTEPLNTDTPTTPPETGETSENPSVRVKKRVQIKENSVFGKKCYKVFKIFVNCFTMTFLAEWGDRSQLATIVLASINNVGGVCVGGVLGHTICTGVAVICGGLVAKRISVRAVTLIGALIFIGFAIASLCFSPEEEMIKIDL